MKKPNILLITTDEQRFDHLGVKGTKGLKTPNLDQLCKEGVCFDRAYTVSPLCTPARMSLLTGLYPSVHGAYTIGVTVDSIPEKTLSQLLRDNGYETSLFGKAHFVARPDEDRYILNSHDSFKDFSGPVFGFDYVQTSCGHTTSNDVNQHYKVWLEENNVDYAKYYPDVNGQHDHDAVGVFDIPCEYHDTSWVTQNAVKWINGQTRKHSNSPWFSWVSFQDPHEPFVCPEPWYSEVKEEEIEQYASYIEGEFDDKPQFYKQCYDAGYNGDISTNASDNGDVGTWSSFADGYSVPCHFRRDAIDKKAKDAIRATLGMINFIDYKIGEMINELKSTNQYDNTIIIFTSDHGDNLGAHGIWHKGLCAYDDCQRVPFIVSGQNVKPLATVQPLISLVDIPITILSLCGIDIPQGMQGFDYSGYLTGNSNQTRDGVIIELRATQNVYQQTFISEDNYKLVVYQDFDEGELYDMTKDPMQYKNLFNDPKYTELKINMMHKFLQQNMRKDGKRLPRINFA